MSDQALIIFIKNPVKGKVKTRIGREAGDEVALKIYLELLNHTRRTVSGLDLDRYLYYSNRIEKDLWPEEIFNKKLQEGQDIGERMCNAFLSVCRHHSQVIIIGSDCAQLTKQVLNSAFNELKKNDVVIGPTFDGGYYLLGMNQPYETLFTGIEWSTSEVFRQTKDEIKKLGLRMAEMEYLSDIDFLEDWQKYGWAIP